MVQVTTTQRYDFGDDDLLGLLDFNNGTNFAPEFDPLTPSSLPFCTSRHISSAHNGVINSTSSSSLDGFTIQELKYLTYGIIWPSICALGMLGNVLNLIVLNQPNMKGTAYIYMRGEWNFCKIFVLVKKGQRQFWGKLKLHFNDKFCDERFLTFLKSR